jgi:hypothetical protein
MKTLITMKAKTFIITILLMTAYITLLTAGELKNSGNKVATTNTETTIDLATLAPSVPTVADFSDGTDVALSPEALVSLVAPVTPKEADFNDSCDSIAQVAPQTIAPATPVEADFTR